MAEAEPDEIWVETSQLRMHCLDWGNHLGNAKPAEDVPVLALHGLASSCHWYDLVIPHLADSYRCLAVDQRGHGLTDQPSTGYDWKTLSTDVVEVLDTIGVRQAALLGHSWGGYVALSVASYYPERVSRLALVDGGFMDWTLWPSANWDWFSNLLRPRLVPATRDGYLEDLRRQLAECWSDQLEGIVMTMAREEEDGTIRDIFEPGNHAQVLQAIWNEPPSTMYPRIKCPTLIVAAGPRSGQEGHEYNRMRHTMSENARSAIADCRVEWVPETMHDIGYHKPLELAHLLEGFLAGS